MIMNNITFLFFGLVLCFFQSKTSNSEEIQKISIRFENQSLESALNQLELALDQDIKVGKYNFVQFVYQDTIVDKANIINQSFEDRTITHVLDVLLENSDYRYVIINSWLLIIYKKFDDLSKNGQLYDSIEGKVVDERGKNVRGVSICIKEEDDAVNYMRNLDCTYTDNDGNFIISTMSPNAYIIAMYVGYLPRVVHIKDAGLIKLEPNLAIMDKVFRIGD